MAISLELGTADLERLRDEAAALGQTLSDVALERFQSYARLLSTWHESTNLISCQSATELVERHLLDAIACVWPSAAARDLVDLGSGAGLPGVPLAIIDSERRVVLVEPRRRRANFLRQVRRELRLERVEVCEMRAEENGATSHVEPAEIAITRAVWADDSVANLAAPWIRGEGMLLSLRSANHPTARVTAPLERCAIYLEQSMTYQVCGIRRRLDVYRKRFTGSAPV